MFLIQCDISRLMSRKCGRFVSGESSKVVNGAGQSAAGPSQKAVSLSVIHTASKLYNYRNINQVIKQQ